MSVVGIIANPASGKDIRRLVAHATVFDNMEKVNLVRRILLGLQAAGVSKALMMPDYFGIGTRALEGLNKEGCLQMEVSLLDMEITGTQEDSLRAARAFHQLVDCIITLGGDGTSRIVAKGCGETPMLPVSTGTNNVFPIMLEGTVAGLAAGFIATGGVAKQEGLRVHKRIDVYLNGQFTDIALVDAVVVKEQFIGSRAIWNVENIQQIFATRGGLDNIGIVSVVGALQPVQITDPHGLYVVVGPSDLKVKAALGPGLVVDVPVQEYGTLQPNHPLFAGKAPFVVALDGERELQVPEGAIVEMVLNNKGPWVVDVQATLAKAAAKGLMRRFN